MIIGYARVSTNGQDTELQRRALLDAGAAHIYEDTASGSTAQRPQLQAMLLRVQSGDIVLIPALDRLGRDVVDVLTIARDLKTRGVGLRSLAEPYIDTGNDFGEVVIAILGVVANLERKRILERTAEGRAAARAAGVRFGRKPKLTAAMRADALRRRDVDKESVRSIARWYGVDPSMISRL